VRRILDTIAMVTFVSAVGADAQPQSQPQSFDSNGVHIAYIDQGQGEPVLLLHGLNGTKEGWQPAVVPRLTAAGFRVVAHDARAAGDSGYPTGPEQYGQEDVNDVIRLLDHLSIDRAHIVGYSRGGWIASRVVLQQSLRVRSAVLGGWGVDDPIDTMPLSDCLAIAEAIEQGKPPVLLLRALTPIGMPVRTVPAPNPLPSPEIRTGRAAAWRGVCTGPRVTAAGLSATAIPVLAIVGELDGIMPSVKAMARHIPAWETVVIAGASHGTAQANPAFVDAVEAFLRRQRVAGR
jgi:pimeloyl-ACP methyl ester carboxylesterase